MNPDQIISNLRKWAESNNNIRALVLTSSRSGKTNAPIDQFSDYDVVVYVKSLDSFQNDNWLSFFGNILVKWPLKPESEFGENWLTRLVLFENYTRIDFQVTTETNTPPSDYDLGYRVIIDKDGFTNNFPKITKTKHLIKKPTIQQFQELVNAFFWDSTYIPKYLYRKDLFYTHYMLEVNLRFTYFEKMIEWYIGSQNDWNVSTNVHGRLFPKYLDKNTWEGIKDTFVGAKKEDVWKAFFKLVKVFTSLAKTVAKKCGYLYPKDQEIKMMDYYQRLKETFDKDKILPND